MQITLKESKTGLQFAVTTICKHNDRVMVHNLNGGDFIEVKLSLKNFLDAWNEWQKGVPIQYAFSALPPEQREFLLSAITPEEWNTIFRDNCSESKGRE